MTKVQDYNDEAARNVNNVFRRGWAAAWSRALARIRIKVPGPKPVKGNLELDGGCSSGTPGRGGRQAKFAE